MFRRVGSPNLTRSEIAEACACDPVIAKAYAAFRRLHPLAPISDLWASAHLNSNVEEAMVESDGRLYLYLNGSIHLHRP